MKNKFIILGIGRYAQVIADAVVQSEDCLSGFLLDDSEEEEAIKNNLGRYSDAENFSDAVFIIGEKDNNKRECLSKKYDGLNYAAVVHKNASVGTGVRIGVGSYIGAGAIIGTNTVIGDHVIIGDGAVIGDHSVIKEFSHLMARVNIGSGVTILDHTFIGLSATLKDNITIASGTVIQTGEIVVKDMVMKMVYKRGAWIYKENG
ncbi:MAG: hypothetical protein RR841_04140 [Eubacterium sp.]